MATPPFLIEPVFDESGEVVPFHEERRVTDPVGMARNEVLSQYQFDVHSALERLLWAARILDKGSEPVLDHTGVITEVPIGRERGNQIAKGADIRLRILNKVMPDIRPVVIADQKDEQVFDFRQVLKAAQNSPREEKETPPGEDQSPGGVETSTED